MVWRTLERYREMAGKHGLVVEDLGTLAQFGHVSDPTRDVQHMVKMTRKR